VGSQQLAATVSWQPGTYRLFGSMLISPAGITLVAATLLLALAGGAVLNGTLFGAYLAISNRWFRMHDNEAFSAMRRKSFKNFLRIRIDDDAITVYPIGLRRIEPGAEPEAIEPPFVIPMR
jgi:hypothetical protein